MEHSPLVKLFEILASATRRSPRTIARITAGSGDVYDRLLAGRDITTRRESRVIGEISDHWPADLDWPADIPRPDPTPGSPAALAEDAA